MQPDGRVHRYRVQGDKSGSRNGWYVLHAHPVLAGAFGSWKPASRKAGALRGAKS
jgi:putative DNA primase/helicase